MTMIRVKRKATEFEKDSRPHLGLSRRDFIKRGLATTTLSTLAPTAVLSALSRDAMASVSCPTANRAPGGLAQLFRAGGCAMGATFLNNTQMGLMNATVAADYGITGTLTQVGSNWWVDKSSPFGLAVTTPPPGWVGGASAWMAALGRTSLGGHYGPFNADDAVGASQGQIAGCGAMKPSYTNTDLWLNPGGIRSPWSKPMPSYQPSGDISTLTPAVLQGGFGMVPSTGLTPSLLTNAANTAEALSNVFMSLFGGSKNGATQAFTNAICGFRGDSTISDPNFAPSLFQYTNLSALTSVMDPSQLSPEMQSFLVSFYQSAIGNLGGISVQQNGNDYHPPQPQTNAAPIDYEAGQIFAMWLAASVAAAQPSAFIMNSNGRVHCNGTTSNTFTPPSGTAVTVNGPNSVGDGGGSYNAGLVVLYGPTSAPSGLQSTGTFDSNGFVTASSAIPTVPAAIAGLYLTAFSYFGNVNMTNAYNILIAGGISNPSSLKLL